MTVEEASVCLAERLRAIRLIAIDLDGTMLDDSKHISEANLSAVKRAMDKGIRICVSTGRAWPGAKAFVSLIAPNAPVITSNGAMLVDHMSQRILYDLGLSDEAARFILKEGTKRDTSMIIWSENILYGNRLDERLEDYGKRFGLMPPKLAPEGFGPLLDRGISKILWYDTLEKTGKYSGELYGKVPGSVTMCTSQPMFLEFFNSAVSKAVAVGKVASSLGIAPGEVMCIGDAGNDMEMLKAAGLGVAMGNADEEVKRICELQTDDNNSDGVAKAIEAVLNLC